jgi:hypothetical protein
MPPEIANIALHHLIPVTFDAASLGASGIDYQRLQ